MEVGREPSRGGQWGKRGNIYSYSQQGKRIKKNSYDNNDHRFPLHRFYSYITYEF